MWNIQSTTRLLKDMSTSAEPGDLVRLLFDHIRQSIHVERVLVLGSAGVSAPQYRPVHNVDGSCGSIDLVGAGDGLREGGLLAELLYAGGFRNNTEFAPDASDPAFDLLRGSQQQASADSCAWPLAGWAHALPSLLTNLVHWLLLLLAIFLMLSERRAGGAAAPPEANAAPMDVRPAR